MSSKKTSTYSTLSLLSLGMCEILTVCTLWSSHNCLNSPAFSVGALLFRSHDDCDVFFYACRASVVAFQALVYEYAAEMTYPLPEGTSGGLVNWVSQV